MFLKKRERREKKPRLKEVSSRWLVWEGEGT